MRDDDKIVLLVVLTLVVWSVGYVT
jgi:hypothetical protein